MKCAISHPNIAPYIRQSVLAYQEHGLLKTFCTTYFHHPEYPLSQNLIRFFPKWETDFKRRGIPEIEYSHIKGHPYLEMLRIFSARRLNAWIENRIWEKSELNFDKWVSKSLDTDIQWVHTYEHAALATLNRARNLGILSFLEQSSQHHQFLDQLINEQLLLYPELLCQSTRLLIDSKAQKSDKRKDLELQAADYVICNSNFTFRTLTSAGVPSKKLIVIPLGFPSINASFYSGCNTKFTFLFAGNQCLRKGIHILYKAWTACDFDPSKAQMIIIGKNQLPDSIKKGLPLSVKFIPNIPNWELMKFYKQADVFVLPTLADGFGMVISESMSMGLPVITTMNSGGPDIITHNKNGFLVEAGNIKALASQMQWCFKNQKETSDIGVKAMASADEYSWKEYRKKLITEVTHRVLPQY